MLCDDCETWFHISCQNIGQASYQTLADHPSFSWVCNKCGSINYSRVSGDTMSDSSSNTYSVLDHDPTTQPSDCEPLLTSTPTKHRLSTSTQRIQGHTKTPQRLKLKVLCINFQSVKNKKSQLHHLLDSTKPDIVAGTETWLTENIKDGELFRYVTGRCMRGIGQFPLALHLHRCT